MSARKKLRPHYAVGYAKPPIETRFQPGQSGNPKGRPRGSLNMATVLEKALREKVLVTENGRQRRISKLDAAMKQVVNKAATGDAKAIQILVTLSREGGVRAKPPAEPAAIVAEADELVMRDIVRRIKRAESVEKE